jgi:hypothetical protein
MSFFTKCACGFLLAAPTLVLAGDLPLDQREGYEKDFHASCAQAQKTDPLGKHLSEVQRDEYCKCAAKRSAETITLEEIGAMLRTQSADPMKPHLQAVQRHCSEKLMPTWMPKR